MNSTSTVLWEPGRATVPATRQPGGRASFDASARGGAAGGAWLGRELRQELVDDAIDRARSGLSVDDLPAGVREQLTDGLIDELLAGRSGEAEILGPGGLLGDLTRRLVERAMAAELTDHLGYEPHAVLEDAKAWQSRPLEAVYPIVYLDALIVKIRDGQAIRNFACYLAPRRADPAGAA